MSYERFSENIKEKFREQEAWVSGGKGGLLRVFGTQDLEGRELISYSTTVTNEGPLKTDTGTGILENWWQKQTSWPRISGLRSRRTQRSIKNTLRR